MEHSNDIPTDADWSLFHEAEQDVSALRVAAAKAKQILGAKDWAVKRFSDLLDEVLPSERALQDQIARAVCLTTPELDALRRHRVDPLVLPAYSLVILAEEFGIQRDTLRDLLMADHKPFENARSSARGTAIAAGWQEFEQAWNRIREENPARYTAPDEDVSR